jgi:hypothetical protein
MWCLYEKFGGFIPSYNKKDLLNAVAIIEMNILSLVAKKEILDTSTIMHLHLLSVRNKRKYPF